MGKKRERYNGSHSKSKRNNNKRPTGLNTIRNKLNDEDESYGFMKRKGDSQNSDDEDKEYCIQNCLIGRKYAGNNMIECDSCGNWYHCKCIVMTDDQFQTIRDNNTNWYCNSCESKN